MRCMDRTWHWLPRFIVLLLYVADITESRQHRGSKESSSRHHVKLLSSSELCSKEGFFRHPNDCRLYLRCVDEFGSGRQLQAFEGNCDPGLVFDDNISACNWPQLAPPCEPSLVVDNSLKQEFPTKINNNKSKASLPFFWTQKNTNANMSQEKVVSNDQHIFVEPLLCKNEGYYAHPSICNEFYKCKKVRSHFVIEVYKCQNESEVFDSTRGSCVEATEKMNLECENKVKHRRFKRQAQGDTLRCQAEGFFRHPSDCNAFYRCVETRPGIYSTYLFACPSTLVFDEEAATCNWPQRTTPCEQSSAHQRVAKPKPVRKQQPYGTRLSTTRSPATTKRTPTRRLQRPTTKRPTSQKTTKRPPTRQSQKTTTTRRPPSKQVQRTTTRKSPTKQYQSTSNGCKASGLFPEPSQCGKFYRCVSVRRGEYKRYDLTCPGDKAFDFRRSECSKSLACSSRRSQFKRPQNDEEQVTTAASQSATEGSSGGGGESGENIECKEEGYFRHPNDCNKFYRCVDFKGDGQSYVRYDFDCPEGLVFDEVNSVCNWPEQTPPCEAGGKGSSGGKDSEKEGTGSESGTGGEGGTNGQGEGGTDGQGEGGPDGTEGGSESETGGEPPTEGSPEGDGSSSKGSGECTTAGYFRDPSDCTKFYRCVDFSGEGQEFVRYDFECPEGLVFDDRNTVCNWPDQSPPCEGGSDGGERETENGDGSSSESGGSSDGTESSSESGGSEKPGEGSTSSQGSGESGECTQEGFYRNPSDCSKFYRCVDRGDGQSFVRYDFECPEGLIFDEVNSVCNWPQQTPGCDSGGKPGEQQQSTTSGSSEQSSEATPSGSEESTSVGGGDSTTEATQSSTSSGESDGGECSTEGYFRKSSDCVEFYRCVKEEDGSFTRYDFECPEGLIFDEKNTKCDWPSEENTCESGGAGGGDGQCTEEGFFQDPNDCRKYYRCTDEEGNGSLTKAEFSCKEGEVFDEEMRFCNRADPDDPCKIFDPQKGGSSSTTDGTGDSSSSGSTPSSGSESTSGGSSDQMECTEEGFYRHPSDCSKFYRCVDFKGDGQSYVRYDFDCPEGLVFDKSIDGCNWPDQSSSCDSSTPDKSTSSESGSTASSGETESSSGQTTESSQESASTSSGGSGSTESSTQSGGGGSSTRSPPSSSIQCTEEGFYRHPEDCSKFYRCVDFKGDGQSYVRYDFECPEGLVFDETNSVCNWPDQSPPCGGGDSATENPGSDSESDEGVCKEEGFFQHPKDCTRYYQCERNEETGELTRSDFQCPADHFFDEEGRYCNSDDFGQSCKNGEQKGTQEPEEFQCKEEGFFRDPKDCGAYYQCTAQDDGSFEEKHENCPDGHVFDEGGRYCNADELSEESCRSSSSSSSTSSSDGTTSASSSTESSGSSSGTSDSSKDVTPSDLTKGGCTEEGFFRNEEDCTKYYQCTKSDDGFDRQDHQCPDGHVFDEAGRYCNSEELIDGKSCAAGDGSSNGATDSTGGTESSNGDGKDTTDSSTGGSAKRSGDCTAEGFFRNPEDCNKFYRCVDFKGDGQSYTRYDFDCPEGLHFDEVNSVCNWPTMTPPCENA